jgi:hypothetical protein
MLLWSHAHLRRKPQSELLKSMIKHATTQPQAYTTQGSTNLLWALHQVMPPAKMASEDDGTRNVMRVFNRHASAIADAVVSAHFVACM